MVEDNVPNRRRKKMLHHGYSRTPTYQAWKSMLKRCLTTSNKKYPDYGGRGITVCQRWIDSFLNFLADMGERPSAKHTLERSDNDKGYEPGNVIWATMKVQSRNKLD